MSEEEYQRLRMLFHLYDVDNSGRIEKNEFFNICEELRVPSQEANRIFNRLDADGDGTVTLEEFISGFKEQHHVEDDGSNLEDKNSKREVSDNTEYSLSW